MTALHFCCWALLLEGEVVGVCSGGGTWHQHAAALYSNSADVKGQACTHTYKEHCIVNPLNSTEQLMQDVV